MVYLQQVISMACNLLTVQEFRCNLHWVKFKRKEGSVTVLNSKERVVALANATTLDPVFSVIGEDRFSNNSMFKAADFLHIKLEWKIESNPRKIGWLQKQGSEKPQIFYQGKHIWLLTRAELNILLKWCKVDKSTEGKVTEKRKRWEDIASGWASPTYKEWTRKDNAALACIEAKPVLMKGTAFSCLKEKHKKDLMARFRALSRDEQNEWMELLKDMNAAKVAERKKKEEEREGGWHLK